MAKATVEFMVGDYVGAHGKMPRGRGSWAFVLYEHKDVSVDSDHVFWTKSVPYAEARKAAKEHFLKDRQPSEYVRVQVLT